MSLRLKMILGIGAILLLIILVFAILASSGQANHLLIAARHEADVVATLTDRAVANGMERGEQEAVQAILRRMGESPGVIGIRVVDSGGTIVRSSNPEEIGRALQKDRLPREGTLEPVWELGDDRVGVFRPILNGAKCAR